MEMLKNTTAIKSKEFDKFNSFLLPVKQGLNEAEIEMLERAFNLAYEVHEGQFLESGLPYIYHPIEVAEIVTLEIGLGYTSIMAAILHEVVTKGKKTYKEIESEYGKDIAIIVKGLTKVSGIVIKTASPQAENFRKLLLTMASDIRVVLIKIADRLQHMRSIESKPPERQLRLALETSFLYVPLAHRLGLYNIKTEMDDISLKYLDFETYDYIDKKLKESTSRRNKYIKEFTHPIEDKLLKEGFDFEIKGRTKSVSSIWSKMKKQDVDFDSIYDIFAIRIIFETVPEREKENCWKIYSIVTEYYKPNPARLREWISIPKSNGYESLHTTVMGPEGKWVEVQIRTRRMDEMAERGLAAHYRYKGVKETNQGLENWLSSIRDLLENSENTAPDFIDQVKLNLYSDEVFVFTPKGDLRKMPVNSTVLDFAYDIHSEVGNRCVGAKINNRNVTIREKLQNGDQIEILTSKTQKPNTDWLNYVVTTKAKAKIKVALREEKLQEAELGKETIKRRFKNWKIPYIDENINKLLQYYKLQTALDLYQLVSKDEIDLMEIKNLLTGVLKKEEKPKIPLSNGEKTIIEGKPEEYDYLSDDLLVIEDKIQSIDFKLAKCCNPVFGDKIFGFVTIGEGIKIHRFNCPNAPQLLSRYGYRVVRARWTNVTGNKSFQTIIKISGINEPGLLGQISDVFSNSPKIVLRSMTVDTNEGMFEGILKIFVTDTLQLDSLLKRLLKIKNISKAIRLNS